MENYKPNSRLSKEKDTERKQLEKVVTGKAHVREKGKAQKFADIFISEDAANVKNYIFKDVFVPALKKLVSDIVKDGIEMVLYGGTGRGGRKTGGFRDDYVPYNRYSDHRDGRVAGYDNRRTNYSYNDIVLENRGEAEAVLSRMDELLEQYGVVSIADLYDLVGEPHNYTDCKYGWMNLRSAEAVRVRDGYMLRLPRALPID